MPNILSYGTAPGGATWLDNLKKDPDFQKLSPPSQQVLLAYADQHKGAYTPQAIADYKQALTTDPKLQAAVTEAKQLGALDHSMSPFMKALVAASFVPLGFAVAGAAGVGPWAKDATKAAGSVSPPSTPESNPQPGDPGFMGPVNTAANAAGGVNWGDIIKKIAAVGIPVGALVAGRAVSNNNDVGNGSSAVPPELSALLAQSMKRVADQDPLAEALNRQALGGLPDYAKGGR